MTTVLGVGNGNNRTYDSILYKKKSGPSHYALPISTRYVGLVNQGSTCHINASLQIIYTIIPLQQAIKNVPNKILNLHNQLMKYFHIAANYGVGLMLGNASFFILVVISLFMGVLSATINAFTGFLTFYVLDFLNSLNK